MRGRLLKWTGMTKIQQAAALLGLFALQACAPVLTPEGARVRTVSKEFGEGCEKLGRVEGVAPWEAPHGEPDGLTSINLARNKAAALGGDSIVIQVKDQRIPPGPVWDGRGMGERYVTRAEALRCER